MVDILPETSAFTQNITHIRWQEVIDTSYDPKSDPTAGKADAKLSEPAQIENTENGQQLFRALLAKQTNLEYADGQYEGQKVKLLTNSEDPGAAHLESESGGRFLTIDPEHQRGVVFITPEGERVKPLLADTLFHELSHASDSSLYDSNTMIDARIDIQRNTGIVLSDEKDKFDVDDKGQFFQSLNPNQQQILLELKAASQNPNVTDEAFGDQYLKHYGTLLENNTLYQMETLKLAIDKERYKGEDYAVDRSNAFVKELLGDKAYTRGSYFESEYDEKYKALPAGVILSNLSLKPGEKQLNAVRQQEWEQEHGAPVRSADIKSQEWKMVPPDFPMELLKEKIQDIPLFNLKHCQMEHVPSHVSLNASPTPEGKTATVRSLS
jgi:hypothetical protein